VSAAVGHLIDPRPHFMLTAIHIEIATSRPVDNELA
jgi:hypothetical protein